MFRENLLGSFLFLAQAITPTTAAAATTDQQWPLPNTQPLRFTPNGTFQISVFEDLHYGEGWYSDLFRGTKDSFHVASDPLPLTRLLAEDLDWGPQQDVDSERVINTVLDAESPQLVILNGDLITGENTYLANSSLYVDEIVRPLVQRGLTWASTYGNHDSNFNLSGWAMLEREHAYPNSRTQSMVPCPDARVTNYFLQVFSSNVTETAPKLILWFFDSGGGNHFQELDDSGNEIPYPEYVDASVSRST
jgi:hypothetical protein